MLRNGCTNPATCTWRTTATSGKASGSYYTPDHIVKYIVENTVGPVMAEKFDKLRPQVSGVPKRPIGKR